MKSRHTDTAAGVGKHRLWRKILIILHALIFVITVAINYLASPALMSSSIFESDTGAISDQYDTKITPASWTFTIWAFIYTWQIIHVVYSLTLLCRKGSDGNYLYVNPEPLHYSFYIVYIINNLLNIGWIIAFDRSGKRPELLIIAMFLLWLITFTLYICGVLICKYLNSAGATLEQSSNVKDIWMIRMFTLNGIAFYGTWCTIASLLNFTIVLQYRTRVSEEMAVWISLGILTVEIIAWFILETFVFDKQLRYCFSQYITLLVALSGLLSKQADSSKLEACTLYVIFLLSITAVLSLVKFCIMVFRGSRKPIIYSHIEPTCGDAGAEAQWSGWYSI